MSKKTRREKDSLGFVEIPEDAFYGPQTVRALANFQISRRTAPPSLLRAYLRLKAAAAQANQTCGVITREHADLIKLAVDELISLPDENLPAIFPIDPYQAGAGTSQNMNINEVIAHVANTTTSLQNKVYPKLHPNDHVNRSQSTNDTYPTAMRLALLDESQHLGRELTKLSEVMAEKADQWRSIPKSARTHLQDAVPMTLGQEWGAYSATTRRCAHWIETSRDAMRELGIGGSAAGTGLTVPQGYIQSIVKELSRLTHEPLRSAPDLCEAMQSQAPVMHFSSMLRITALELTRICNDLRLLASGPMTGLAELLLPAAQPGSSIMPGKVNPSILEAANQAFFGVLGHDQAVAFAMQAGQLELNVMMPLMAFQLLEATQIATNAVRMLRERCIQGIQPNLPRLKRYYESTPQMATALSPALGYEATAKLVQEALATDKSVIDLVREKGLLSEEKLSELLDPKNLLGSIR